MKYERLLLFATLAKLLMIYTFPIMQNELTGEHTCIMLNALDASDLDTNAADGWLNQYVTDFRYITMFFSSF